MLFVWLAILCLSAILGWYLWRRTTALTRFGAWAHSRLGRYNRLMNPRFLVGTAMLVCSVIFVVTQINSGITRVTEAKTQKVSTKTDSVKDSSVLGKTLIDSTLSTTPYIDKGFQNALVQTKPVGRSKYFWGIIILMGIVCGIYSAAKKFQWGGADGWSKKLPPIQKPLYMVLFGIPVIHWLWWALSPISWENFYQSNAFWPMNFAVVTSGVFASINEKTGGKQYAKVIKYMIITSVAFVIYFVWPKNMNLRANIFGDKSVSSTQTRQVQGTLSPEVAEAIEKHFGDLGSDTVAIMKRIALAESDGMQFRPDGSVVLNKDDGKATGVFQIHPVNFDTCYKLSMSVYTLEGNVACARVLFDQEDSSGAKIGTKHWNSSASRWRTAELTTSNPVVTENTKTPVTEVSNSEDIILITAPAAPDSAGVSEAAWSEPAYTQQKFFCWGDKGNTTPYEVRDELGNTTRMQNGSHVRLSRYPKYVQFRSLGTQPIEIVFKRSKTAC